VDRETRAVRLSLAKKPLRRPRERRCQQCAVAPITRVADRCIQQTARTRQIAESYQDLCERGSAAGGRVSWARLRERRDRRPQELRRLAEVAAEPCNRRNTGKRDRGAAAVAQLALDRKRTLILQPRASESTCLCVPESRSARGARRTRCITG